MSVEKNPEPGLVVQMDDPYESRKRRLAHNSSPPPPPNSNKWIVWVITILLLLGGAAAAIAVLYKSNGDSNNSEAPVVDYRAPPAETTFPATIPLPVEEPWPDQASAENDGFFPLAVSVTPSNATIELDGEVVAQGSYSTRLEVNGEVHKARFYADGYEERTLTFKDQSPPTSLQLSPLATSPRVSKQDRGKARRKKNTKSDVSTGRRARAPNKTAEDIKSQADPKPKPDPKPRGNE